MSLLCLQTVEAGDLSVSKRQNTGLLPGDAMSILLSSHWELTANEES